MYEAQKRWREKNREKAIAWQKKYNRRVLLESKKFSKECEGCGKSFLASEKQRFCHGGCVLPTLKKSSTEKRENNCNWKGDDATYNSKHRWIQKNFGNPKKCEECGKIGKKNQGKRSWNLHWANISGKHKRDIKDYRGMCVPCHMKYDGKTTPDWKVKKALSLVDRGEKKTVVARKLGIDRNTIYKYLKIRGKR